MMRNSVPEDFLVKEVVPEPTPIAILPSEAIVADEKGG